MDIAAHLNNGNRNVNKQFGTSTSGDTKAFPITTIVERQNQEAKDMYSDIKLRASVPGENKAMSILKKVAGNEKTQLF